MRNKPRPTIRSSRRRPTSNRLRATAWLCATVCVGALLLATPSTAGVQDAPPSATPPSAGVIGLDGAAHLLGRAGLGATPEQLHEYAPMTRVEAIDRLLTMPRATGTRLSPPDWIDARPADDFPESDRMGISKDDLRKKVRDLQRQRGRALKAWWYEELLSTDAPLRERMTLFWHNHFTSSLQKVKDPRLMYQQNALLREHALGSFQALVGAVARDAAMLQYLDGQRSRKNKPNENFARELLELFTLGEGHYTESDIKEAARAFTGWRVQRRTGETHNVRRQHDRGKKTFMGETGTLDGDDIVRIVLENPQTARFITEKLWHYLVSPEPDASEVDRLAKVFRDSKYDTKTLVRAMLLSPTFWAGSTRGSLAKSPVDLLVGTVRAFDLPIWDIGNLVQASRRLGQDLLDPPNVKGWPGGANWISSTTLLLREQFLTAVTTGGSQLGNDRGRKVRTNRTFTNRWLARLAGTPKTQRTTARSLLLRVDHLTPIEVDDAAEYVWQLLRDPAYQVK